MRLKKCSSYAQMRLKCASKMRLKCASNAPHKCASKNKCAWKNAVLMHNKKSASGKFKSVAPKRKVAKNPYRFDRHRAKICPNPNIFAYSKSPWTGANIHVWVKYAFWNSSCVSKIPSVMPKKQRITVSVFKFLCTLQPTKFPPPPPLLHSDVLCSLGDDNRCELQCCNVLQCVAMCCSVLQCVAVYCVH